MSTRWPRLPQSTGDFSISNNVGYVWGLQGLPMQEWDVNSSGVLYLDPSLERWSIQDPGVDIRGPWPNLYVEGITGIHFDVNAGPPLHGQVPSYSDTNGSLSWVDTNGILGNAGGDVTGSWNNLTVVGIQTIDVNPATPLVGQLLEFGENSQWNPTDSGAPPMVIYVDQKTSGTAGGTFTTGSWVERALQTVVQNDGGIASISGNEVTLPAGTYDITCSAPAHRVAGHKARLYDVTNSVVIGNGTSESCGTASNEDTRSWVMCRVTVEGPTAFRIEHYCTTTRATDGRGQAAGIPSTDEIYSTFQAIKVS